MRKLQGHARCCLATMQHGRWRTITSCSRSSKKGRRPSITRNKSKVFIDYNKYIYYILIRIEESFDVFDHEQNKTVDVREIGTIIRSLGCYPTEAELHDMIQVHPLLYPHPLSTDI